MVTTATQAPTTGNDVFRVRMGKHTENDHEGVERTYTVEDGPFRSTCSARLRSWPEKFEQVGGTILFANTVPPVDPFAKRGDESPAEFAKRMTELAAKATQAAGRTAIILDNLSVEQLIAHAEEHEIDLPNNLKGNKDRRKILEYLKGVVTGK